MEEPADGELVRLARDGNPDAFRILIRRYDRRLFRVARSILLDDQDAEDVVQETCIRVFTRIVDFRGDASFSSWFTRIAINEALQRRRQRRTTVDLHSAHRAELRNDPSIHFSPAASNPDPERAAAQRQIQTLLERAIDELPAAFRTVLVLRDVEEVTTEETARLLGLRQGTVRTRLHRARRILRETLGEQIKSVLKDVFPFDGLRCDRLVEGVLGRLGLAHATPLSK